MGRFRFFVTFFLIVFGVFALSAAEENAPKKAKSKPKTNVENTYSFAEELLEIPIKPFVANKLTEQELLNSTPQLLKLYEAAVNAEGQKNAVQNARAIVKAWNDVAKITDKNPFLQTANTRLAEWKTCTDLLKAHQDSLDKIKTLISSTLLTDEQKTNIVMQHLSEFGLSFGTQEVIDLVNKTAIQSSEAFKAKVKETKQKRCEHNSGKDCFECGRDFVTVEYEKLMLFNESCNLKYQPGCDEVNKIKAAKDAEKAKLAAEEKRKAEEFAKRSFALQDEPINVIKPFVLGMINEQDILTADPKVLKMFEDTVNKEKQPNVVATPGAMIIAWEEITKITEKNPFQQIAAARLAEWRTCLEKLEKYEAKIAELNKVETDNSLPANYKAAYAVNYLNDFGVSFGTTDVVKATVYLEFNEVLATKIKDTRKQRCDLKSAGDCHTYGLKHSANEEEKAAYLKKACELGRKQACPGNQQQNIAEAPVENAQPQVAEQPKKSEKKPAEEDKFKEELNKAGRKKRIAIATSTLVTGTVLAVLGGVSLYGMSKAKKDRDTYYDWYYYSVTQEEMDYYRQKTLDKDKERKTFRALGGVGIGVGAALIATGITFYCIEFEGEKEVKKKYNVSFGANPANGTLQFALNW